MSFITPANTIRPHLGLHSPPSTSHCCSRPRCTAPKTMGSMYCASHKGDRAPPPPPLSSQPFRENNCCDNAAALPTPGFSPPAQFSSHAQPQISPTWRAAAAPQVDKQLPFVRSQPTTPLHDGRMNIRTILDAPHERMHQQASSHSFSHHSPPHIQSQQQSQQHSQSQYSQSQPHSQSQHSQSQHPQQQQSHLISPSHSHSPHAQTSGQLPRPSVPSQPRNAESSSVINPTANVLASRSRPTEISSMGDGQPFYSGQKEVNLANGIDLGLQKGRDLGLQKEKRVEVIEIGSSPPVMPDVADAPAETDSRPAMAGDFGNRVLRDAWIALGQVKQMGQMEQMHQMQVGKTAQQGRTTTQPVRAIQPAPRPQNGQIQNGQPRPTGHTQNEQMQNGQMQNGQIQNGQPGRPVQQGQQPQTTQPNRAYTNGTTASHAANSDDIIILGHRPTPNASQFAQILPQWHGSPNGPGSHPGNHPGNHPANHPGNHPGSHPANHPHPATHERTNGAPNGIRPVLQHNPLAMYNTLNGDVAAHAQPLAWQANNWAHPNSHINPHPRPMPPQHQMSTQMQQMPPHIIPPQMPPQIPTQVPPPQMHMQMPMHPQDANAQRNPPYMSADPMRTRPPMPPAALPGPPHEHPSAPTPVMFNKKQPTLLPFPPPQGVVGGSLTLPPFRAPVLMPGPPPPHLGQSTIPHNEAPPRKRANFFKRSKNTTESAQSKGATAVSTAAETTPREAPSQTSPVLQRSRPQEAMSLTTSFGDKSAVWSSAKEPSPIWTANKRRRDDDEYDGPDPRRRRLSSGVTAATTAQTERESTPNPPQATIAVLDESGVAEIVELEIMAVPSTQDAKRRKAVAKALAKSSTTTKQHPPKPTKEDESSSMDHFSFLHPLRGPFRVSSRAKRPTHPPRTQEEMDTILYSQPAAQLAPPQGVSIGQKSEADKDKGALFPFAFGNPKAFTEGQLYLHMDPRMHYATHKTQQSDPKNPPNTPKTDTQSLPIHPAPKPAVPPPAPPTYSRPMDFGDVPEDELPDYVRANPQWLRACAWMRECRQKRLRRAREVEMCRAKGVDVGHLVKPRERQSTYRPQETGVWRAQRA